MKLAASILACVLGMIATGAVTARVIVPVAQTIAQVLYDSTLDNRGLHDYPPKCKP